MGAEVGCIENKAAIEGVGADGAQQGRQHDGGKRRAAVEGLVGNLCERGEVPQLIEGLHTLVVLETGAKAFHGGGLIETQFAVAVGVPGLHTDAFHLSISKEDVIGGESGVGRKHQIGHTHHLIVWQLQIGRVGINRGGGGNGREEEAAVLLRQDEILLLVLQTGYGDATAGAHQEVGTSVEIEKTVVGMRQAVGHGIAQPSLLHTVDRLLTGGQLTRCAPEHLVALAGLGMHQHAGAGRHIGDLGELHMAVFERGDHIDRDIVHHAEIKMVGTAKHGILGLGPIDQMQHRHRLGKIVGGEGDGHGDLGERGAAAECGGRNSGHTVGNSDGTQRRAATEETSRKSGDALGQGHGPKRAAAIEHIDFKGGHRRGECKLLKTQTGYESTAAHGGETFVEHHRLQDAAGVKGITAYAHNRLGKLYPAEAFAVAESLGGNGGEGGEIAQLIERGDGAGPEHLSQIGHGGRLRVAQLAVAVGVPSLHAERLGLAVGKTDVACLCLHSAGQEGQQGKHHAIYSISFHPIKRKK